MEHINRLKRVHQDSVDLMKTEFMSQIARLKVSEFSANFPNNILLDHSQ